MRGLQVRVLLGVPLFSSMFIVFEGIDALGHERGRHVAEAFRAIRESSASEVFDPSGNRQRPGDSPLRKNLIFSILTAASTSKR